MATYTRSQALKIATSSPWTRDLRHVTAKIPKAWSKSRVEADPVVDAVKVKDRVKWWNIVPGDRVRMRGDPDGTIREVMKINKLSNTVSLKNSRSDEDTTKRRPVPDMDVHYSQCQLFVRNQQFPPLPGQTEPRVLPIFATRLGASAPSWNALVRRYDWNRFAVNTTPRLPGYSKDAPEKIVVPWPEEVKKDASKATLYDTPQDVVAECTYTPPPLPSRTTSPIPKAPSEHEYIKALKTRTEIDASLPIEVHVRKELVNPHSRAKKQARWQAHQVYKRSIQTAMVQAEYKELKGRTRREARAEALWKWRQRLADERKQEMMRRWRLRGAEAKLKMKRMRKGKKRDRIHQKLRQLVLEPSSNQVIPRK